MFAKIIAERLNFRYNPCLDGDIKKIVNKGSEFEILDSAYDNEGNEWLKLEEDAWAMAQYINKFSPIVEEKMEEKEEKVEPIEEIIKEVEEIPLNFFKKKK